jgi:hypothetical protein
VSVASDGTQVNADSDIVSSQSISADGRFIVFESVASNLVSDDTNDTQDIFVYDRQSGTTSRVSVASDGTQTGNPSFQPAISGNGRFIVFGSVAGNLVSGDTNAFNDIFVHDRQTSTTTRVSVASDGTQANNDSSGPAISEDGRFVAFQSMANNLVSGDTNNERDIFVHDRQTSTTTRVSVASDGTQGDERFFQPAISGDGRFVVFESDASNLVSNDTNNETDLFVHDRQTGTTTLVSIASDGTQGNSRSFDPAISADGRFIVFNSIATNLVSGDTNSVQDVFVHDRQTGTTTRIESETSRQPSISRDGRFVAFDSLSSSLVSGDTNSVRDVFVHDRQTNTTRRASVSSNDTQGNGDSSFAVLSADGSTVAFISTADNLVSSDTNGTQDIFVRELKSADSIISGSVTDESGNLIVGATISADNGQTTTTGSDGTYALIGLVEGDYTINASKVGCTFTPASLSVSVPPDAVEQNFTATCDTPQTPLIGLEIDTNTVEPDENFEFRVVTTGIPDATGIEFILDYEPNKVACEIGFPGNDQPFPFFVLDRSVCNTAPGRYEWVSTVSQGGFSAGELARIRFRSLNNETSTTIRIIPESVRVVDMNGNPLPIDIGVDALTVEISTATIEGIVTCQAGSTSNPRQTRIFASSFNGQGSSIFTLSRSGDPYALNASTSGNPWSVIAACDCHINARILDVNSSSAGNDVTLRAGDIVGVDSDRDNGEINVRDAVALSARLGGPVDDLACADLNQDGRVDVSDMAILRGNFPLREFTPFDSIQRAVVMSEPITDTADAATVNCRIEQEPDTNSATMIIEVDGVRDLYGYSINLPIDPELVIVPEAWDLSNSLLQPVGDEPSILEMQNSQMDASLEVAVVRQNPAPGVSGSGELARITLQSGSTEGTHTFSFDNIILADQQANFIPHQEGDMSQCNFVSKGTAAENTTSVYLPLVLR